MSTVSAPDSFGVQEQAATAPAPPPLDYAPPPLARTERLVSLDALRGFDMFWILGADALVRAICQNLPGVRGLGLVHDQLDHVDWEGFHFYDLIFPLFVFIVGVSLVFSLGKTIARAGRPAAVRRIIVRSLVIYAFGILTYGGMSKLWPNIRLVGVLQRIAFCYLVAGLLFVYVRPRTLAIVAAALLLGYWGMMALIPVPGVGRGNYAMDTNLANYVDSRWLPGFHWDNKTWDPEGLLSTLPAIGGCLLGVFAGLLMRDGSISPWKKVGILLAAGPLSLAIGLAWGGMVPGWHPHVPGWVQKLKFPVIKKVWTTSFVLVATGWSCILLAAFYLVIDVLRLRAWATPFIWIGMNAITLYMVAHVLSFRNLADLFVGGHVKNALHAWYPVAQMGVYVLFVLLLARFLYKRQIFLRV
jgi:predicted acyltransferase